MDRTAHHLRQERMDDQIERARELQRRVLACPLVLGVDAGPLGAIRTAADDGHVTGILIEPTIVMVCVVAELSDASMVATLVRATVLDHLVDRPVSVSVRPGTPALA